MKLEWNSAGKLHMLSNITLFCYCPWCYNQGRRHDSTSCSPNAIYSLMSQLEQPWQYQLLSICYILLDVTTWTAVTAPAALQMLYTPWCYSQDRSDSTSCYQYAIYSLMSQLGQQWQHQLLSIWYILLDAIAQTTVTVPAAIQMIYTSWCLNLNSSGRTSYYPNTIFSLVLQLGPHWQYRLLSICYILFDAR